jgi:hypothetical protein
MFARERACDHNVWLQERQQLLEVAAAGGCIQDYSGWRVSMSGKRFKLKNVKLFNVTELDGAWPAYCCCCGLCQMEQPLLVVLIS